MPVIWRLIGRSHPEPVGGLRPRAAFFSGFSEGALYLSAGFLSLCAGLALSSPMARAETLGGDSFAPMRFTLVEGGEKNCAPRCGRWIAAQGKIDPGAASRLAAVLAKSDGAPVFIHSPGGSMDDAMAMGRLIRAKNLSVVVAHTAFDANKDGKKLWTSGRLYGRGVCASACAFVLAAGSQRIATPHALVGVHRAQKIRYQPNAGEAAEQSATPARIAPKKQDSANVAPEDQAKLAEFRKYLSNMGMGADLWNYIQSADHSAMRWLAPDELKNAKLVTRWIERPDKEALVINDALPTKNADNLVVSAH